MVQFKQHLKLKGEFFVKTIKKLAGAAIAGAVLLSALPVMPSAKPQGISAQAADFSYPVQKFRIGIGNTDRNVNISGTAAGDYLNSWTTNGAENEKWYLNYISAGVYEIVNSATGYVITNQDGLAVLAPDTDAANQRWQITGTDKDFEGYYLYYKIVSNADTSAALTFNQNSNSISVDTYSGDLYQKFKLNLDGLEGFAANCKVAGGEKAGTIGGLLGETVFVDTTEECVAAMKRTEPLTIVVTGNLEFNDWDQADQKIEDDKTILGSYSANIIYNSRWRNDDFNGDINITPSCNIVLKNLHFRATELNSNGCGVILVYIYCGRNIWFDHNDFSASFGHDRDNEVGKFIWINTPVANWSDGCYNGISPDYITISYNHFNNRYWTVAYGTQNTETTRDRTTLMFNKWENCARRTPQIGNGTGHVYNSYHTYTISDPSQQIIAGDGCKMLTEYCYFEGLTGLEFAGGGSSSSPFRDTGSVSAKNTSSAATAMNKSFSYSHTWTPGTENYGYSLITANDTKAFCNAYSGCFTKTSDIKYITDADLASYVVTKYPCPFLERIEVGNDPVSGAAVMNTNVTYSFRNLNSGLFLEVADSAAEAGANVQQGNSGAAEWTLADAGDGYYYIYSTLADGKSYVLDLAYGDTANGTNIGIWSNTEDDSKKFRFIDNGDGTYTITTKSTDGKSCIGIISGSTEAGANALQWQRNGSDDQKWVAEINGELIKHLTVKDDATRALWSIDTSIATGDLVFADRDVTYTALPEELVGAEAILTACDAKNSTGDLASFTAGADITVYVALDARVSTAPSWLNAWTNTGLTAKNNKDVTFNLYALDCKAGDIVTLGTNGQSSSCVNYTVFAASAAVQNDVNADGVCNIADLVMVQKYIINAGTLTNWQAGDLNRDNRIDAFDLVLWKQLFLS